MLLRQKTREVSQRVSSRTIPRWASYSIEGRLNGAPMTQSDKQLFALELEARSCLLARRRNAFCRLRTAVENAKDLALSVVGVGPSKGLNSAAFMSSSLLIDSLSCDPPTQRRQSEPRTEAGVSATSFAPMRGTRHANHGRRPHYPHDRTGGR